MKSVCYMHYRAQVKGTCHTDLQRVLQQLVQICYTFPMQILISQQTIIPYLHARRLFRNNRTGMDSLVITLPRPVNILILRYQYILAALEVQAPKYLKDHTHNISLFRVQPRTYLWLLRQNYLMETTLFILAYWHRQRQTLPFSMTPDIHNILRLHQYSN